LLCEYGAVLAERQYFEQDAPRWSVMCIKGTPIKRGKRERSSAVFRRRKIHLNEDPVMLAGLISSQKNNQAGILLCFLAKSFHKTYNRPFHFDNYNFSLDDTQFFL